MKEFMELLKAWLTPTTNVDLLIAKTQRSLSQRTLMLIAGVILLMILLPKPLDPLVKDILLLLVGGLVGNWGAQNQFWYGRPRTSGVPDPSAPGTTVESNTRIVQQTPAAPQPADSTVSSQTTGEGK
jgi:hypothetical protein